MNTINSPLPDSSQLHLMHLPHDVLGAIPTIVENAGMGEMPDYLSGNPFVTVQEFATAVFDVIVGSLTCLWNMATHLVGIGLEFIGNLTAAAASVVHDTVEAIVDAFAALVDWVVDLVETLVGDFVEPIVDGIESAIEGFVSGFKAVTAMIGDEYESTEGISGTSLDALLSVLTGDLFVDLMIIGGVADIALMILNIVSGPGSCLVTIALTTIGMVVATNTLGDLVQSSDAPEWLPGSSSLLDWIVGLLPDPATQGQEDELDTAVSVLDWCMDVVAIFIESAACAAGFGSGGDIAVGALLLILAGYTTGTGDILVDVLVTGMSAVLLMHSACNLLIGEGHFDKYAAGLSVGVSGIALTISLIFIGCDLT